MRRAGTGVRLTTEPAPNAKAPQTLVAKFTANRDSYVSPSYDEAQLRKEFLDPMLEALGWDVGNTATGASRLDRRTSGRGGGRE
ncbi:MAG: hypothetical protein JXA57_19555 [Armatimonadetes bacterium]|nr:hypothetical protein [Armatimonadota bacterium]